MLDQQDFTIAALLEAGHIDREGLDRARAHAAEEGCPITESLVALDLVDARKVTIVQADNCEIPFVDLDQYEINLANSRLLPRTIAESTRSFPIFACEDLVTVGMVDPMDLRAVDQIRAALRTEVDAVFCEPFALGRLIDRAYSLTGNAQTEDRAPGHQQGELTTGKEPIVAAVNQILALALDQGASDVHIGPDEKHLHLRFRVDGKLRQQQGPDLSQHAGLIQRLKVMADLDLTQTRKPQDGKFNFHHMGKSVEARLSILPTVSGENAVIRILNSSSAILDFPDLGFSPAHRDQMLEMLRTPHGMILVTGPTGSGKTTTLYTALKQLNTPDRNIMTIEDPVEIRMPMMRQVQARPEVGLTFAGALRSILRQDPDVVFVGEIRDEETARIAIQAALTGHLVLSSLHTNDAAGAVPRLIDLGCPTFAVNAALLGIVAQRLVRRVCRSCSAPSDVPESMKSLVPEEARGSLVRGRGCKSCGNTGFTGRTGIYEILRVGPAVRQAVDDGAEIEVIRQAALRDGMLQMWEDGLRKALEGRTTIDEVARVAVFSGLEDSRPPKERTPLERAA